MNDFLKLRHNCDAYMGVQKERKSETVVRFSFPSDAPLPHMPHHLITLESILSNVYMLIDVCPENFNSNFSAELQQFCSCSMSAINSVKQNTSC